MGAFLWALGGWAWKWIRRFGWPWTVVGVALWYRIPVWRALLYGITASVVLSLGYSPERQHVWWIIFIGAAYGACSLYLSPRWANWWYPVLTGVTFAGCLMISLKWDSFTWKFVELATGAAQGFTVAHAIMQEGKH